MNGPLIPGWKTILDGVRKYRLRSLYLQKCAEALGLEVRAIAEIGVHKGILSRELRRFFPAAHLTLIDPWAHIPELRRLGGGMHRVGGRKGNPEEWEKIFFEVQAAFAGDPKVRLLRALSADAAPQIPDESLDLVYLDGDHRYQYVIEDIRLWTPKLRSGGLLCGHDYKEVRQKRVLYQVFQAVNDDLGRENIVVGRSMTFLWRKP